MTNYGTVPGVRAMQSAWRDYRDGGTARVAGNRAADLKRGELEREYNQADNDLRDAETPINAQYQEARREAEAAYDRAINEARRVQREALAPLRAAHEQKYRELDTQVNAARREAEESWQATGEAEREAKLKEVFGDTPAGKLLLGLVKLRYDGYTGDVTNALRYFREHRARLERGDITPLDLLDEARDHYGWCSVYAGTREELLAQGYVEGYTPPPPARAQLERYLTNAYGSGAAGQIRHYLDAFDREVTERVVIDAIPTGPMDETQREGAEAAA